MTTLITDFNVRLRSTPFKDNNKNTLRILKKGTRLEEASRFNVEWWQVLEGYVHASVVSEVPPPPISTSGDVPYLSQWITPYNRLRGNCGRVAAIGLHYWKTGIMLTLEDMPHFGKDGYTTALQLEKNLTRNGTKARAIRVKTLSEVKAIKSPFILLGWYGGILDKDKQDDNFDGYHWFTVLKFLEDGSVLVNDSNYWGDRVNEGDHKHYDAATVKRAFIPYAGSVWYHLVVLE